MAGVRKALFINTPIPDSTGMAANAGVADPTPPQRKEAGRKPNALRNDGVEQPVTTLKPKRKYTKKPKAEVGEEGGDEPKVPRKKPGPRPKRKSAVVADGAVGLVAVTAKSRGLLPTTTAAGSDSRKRKTPTERENDDDSVLESHDSTTAVTPPLRSMPAGAEAPARKRARVTDDAPNDNTTCPDVHTKLPSSFEESSGYNTVETAPPYPYDYDRVNFPDIPIPQLMSRREAEKRYRGGDVMPPLGSIEGEEGFREDVRFYDDDGSEMEGSSDEGDGDGDESIDVVVGGGGKDDVLDELGVEDRKVREEMRGRFGVRELRNHVAFLADVREAFLRYGMARWYHGMELLRGDGDGDEGSLL